MNQYVENFATSLSEKHSKAELASCRESAEKAYRKDGVCAYARKVEKVGETNKHL